MAFRIPQICQSCLMRWANTTVRRRQGALAPFLVPVSHQLPSRNASSSANAARKKEKEKQSKKKRKVSTHYETPDLKAMVQFSLVDAMRYLRAAEVGRKPNSAKYEVHLKLRTPKNGAVVRNRLHLPHPVKTDLRIAVICDPNSAHAKAAVTAGAVLVGEEAVFDAVKAGRIEFDRCICHQESLQKLAKAGVARILGPRGLMPSTRQGTVVKDVAASVKDIVGASEYRERFGVVRMAVGQLGFTPEEMQRNIRAFVDSVNRDIAAVSDKTPKSVHEVVLSSTGGPGLSLNGDMRSPASIPTRDLSTG